MKRVKIVLTEVDGLADRRETGHYVTDYGSFAVTEILVFSALYKAL